MKLRTFTALLLAAIMLFALTACGSQAADDSSSDQQQEQQDICITMHHLPDHFQRRSRQKGKQRSDRIVDE